MPRNRVIYQSEALFVGPTGKHPATGKHSATATSDYRWSGDSLIAQLHRVQDANYNFTINRQDVNQFGELAAIDRVILEQPTVNLSFSYLQNSLFNESLMGFTVTQTGDFNNASCISGILNKTTDEKNYFIKTVSEGSDAVGVTEVGIIIGIGNGFITSYTAEGAVGGFPKASINIEALNMKFDSVTGVGIPAINPEDGTQANYWTYVLPNASGNPVLGGAGGVTTDGNISTLLPGDITLTIDRDSVGALIDEGGAKISDAKIQSYTLSLDIGRTSLQELGSKYAFAREINFPVKSTLSVTADVGDLTTGNLVDMISTNKDYDLIIRLNKPNSTQRAIQYNVRGANLDSQEFSSSIGANKSVTLNFSAPLGGPQKTGIGLFMSGITARIV